MSFRDTLEELINELEENRPILDPEQLRRLAGYYAMLGRENNNRRLADDQGREWNHEGRRTGRPGPERIR